MPAAKKAVPRPRARATDLDASGTHHGRRLTLPEHRRCVLHLLSAPNDIIRYEPLDHTVAAVRLGRGAVAIDPGIHSAWLDPMEWLDYDLPRGVAWRSHPVVARPRYRVWRRLPVPAMSSSDPFKRSDPVPVDELAVTVSAIVVHLPEGWDRDGIAGNDHALEWIAHAHALAGALSEQVDVALIDPAGAVVGGVVELGHLATRAAAWQRFLWSYAANFSAIAYRALGAAIAAAGPDEGAGALAADVRMRAYRERGEETGTRFERDRRKDPRSRVNGLLHPLALQVLYGIRRRGGAPLLRPIGKGSTQDWQRDLVSDAAGPTASWLGTGRYPPRAIDRETAALVATALVEHGLVRLDGASIVTSRRGDAFLDALPPDCEDPDMPSRWTSLPMGQREHDAMDAWIARAFGKMRRSVDGLPAFRAEEG